VVSLSMAVELNTGDSVELKRNIITIRPIVPRNSELWRFLISSMSAGDHLFGTIAADSEMTRPIGLLAHQIS